MDNGRNSRMKSISTSSGQVDPPKSTLTGSLHGETVTFSAPIKSLEKLQNLCEYQNISSSVELLVDSIQTIDNLQEKVRKMQEKLSKLREKIIANNDKDSQMDESIIHSVVDNLHDKDSNEVHDAALNAKGNQSCGPCSILDNSRPSGGQNDDDFVTESISQCPCENADQFLHKPEDLTHNHMECHTENRVKLDINCVDESVKSPHCQLHESDNNIPVRSCSASDCSMDTTEDSVKVNSWHKSMTPPVPSGERNTQLSKMLCPPAGSAGELEFMFDEITQPSSVNKPNICSPASNISCAGGALQDSNIELNEIISCSLEERLDINGSEYSVPIILSPATGPASGIDFNHGGSLDSLPDMYNIDCKICKCYQCDVLFMSDQASWCHMHHTRQIPEMPEINKPENDNPTNLTNSAPSGEDHVHKNNSLISLTVSHNMNVIPPEGTDLQCQVCGTILPIECRLNLHSDHHAGSNNSFSPSCKIKHLANMYICDVQNTQASSHTGENSEFVYEICDMNFPHTTLLSNNLRQHTLRTHNHCDKASLVGPSRKPG